MTDIKLSEEERQNLKKIDKGNLGLGLLISIREHFNIDMDTLQDSFTEAERKEANEISKICNSNMDNKSLEERQDDVDHMRDITHMQIADIFLHAARRLVGNDKEIAALLPKKFDKKDADLLEKCEMKSLAALVRMRV